MNGKKLLKRIAACVTALVMLACGAVPAFATSSGEEFVMDPEPSIYGEAACLMDADTGAVLYDKNMDDMMYPASLTKIMTTYMALKNGNLSDVVTMTETGVALAFSGSSNLYTEVGEQFTLEQLLYGTMLKSANDMATQVGEYIGGTLDHFVSMMNEEARRIGCTNTGFANACGLPDDGHTTTAHDLAVMSRYALMIPKFREIVSTEEYTIPATAITDHERVVYSKVPLLIRDEYRYEGCIGGKTGFTDLAWSCLAAYAERDGHTLIAVTMHNSSLEECSSDCIKMLDYGFNNFKRVGVGDARYAGFYGDATIPMNADVSDLTCEEQRIVDPERGPMVDFTFYYDGYEAGHILMTEAEYNSMQAVKNAEASQEQSADESSDSSVEVTYSTDATPDISGMVVKKETAFPKTLPEFVDWIQTPPHLVLAGLGLLIAVAILILLCIMVGHIAEESRRRKRRKARERRRERERERQG